MSHPDNGGRWRSPVRKVGREEEQRLQAIEAQATEEIATILRDVDRTRWQLVLIQSFRKAATHEVREDARELTDLFKAAEK